MKLPRKLNPDPIIDSTVEIRFEPLVNPNAVFGILYYGLKDKFPQVENLPVLQVPEAIRLKDSMFAFQPQYRLRNEKFQVQIGPDVLSVHCLNEYIGWALFSSVIFEVLNTIRHLGVIGSVERLGVRYVSFFETNIFKNLKLKLNIPNYPEPNYPITMRLELPASSSTNVNVLQLANNVKLETGNSSRQGSVIDIDTSYAGPFEDFFRDAQTFINEAHETEKGLFYSLLTQSFLDSLNPEY